jgi:hypothetical protein
MDTMFSRMLAAALLASVAVPGVCQSPNPWPPRLGPQGCLPEADKFVREVLEEPTWLGVSFSVHQARMYGDCIAVALTRNLRLSDLRKPGTAAAVVRMLEYAFSSPQILLLMGQDKEPRATLLLLDLVAEYTPDAAARAEMLFGNYMLPRAQLPAFFVTILLPGQGQDAGPPSAATPPLTSRKQGPANTQPLPAGPGDCLSQANTLARELMEQPHYLSVSDNVRQARVLGDCAAMASTENLRLSDLKKPETGAAVVNALEYAFSSPNLILAEEAKQSRASLFLLDLVAEYATDAATRLGAQRLLRQLESVKSDQ